MREKETQELLKMGAGGADKKKTRLLGKVRNRAESLHVLNEEFMFCHACVSTLTIT